MSPTVLKSPRARHDLVEVADYLERAAGLAVAERFLGGVEQALNSLAAMPLMGPPWESPRERLKDVRNWPVPGFRNYLIFYRPLAGGIELLRVLHGARDTETVLEGDPG
jgi:toxin ParE1/3/4